MMSDVDVKAQVLGVFCAEYNLTQAQCNLSLLCLSENVRERFSRTHRMMNSQALLHEPELQLVTYAYVVVFLFGLLGNLLTLFVITRTPRLHSHTNYFLCNLAVSDCMLLLIGVPTDLWYIWMPYKSTWCLTFCLTKNILLGICANASIFTILAMTLEKFIAICYPLHLNWLVNSRAMSTYIGYVWLAAAVPALAMNSQYRLVYEHEPMCEQRIYGMAVCNIHTRLPAINELYLALVFFVPMLLMFYWHLRILYELRGSGRPPQSPNIPLDTIVQSSAINGGTGSSSAHAHHHQCNAPLTQQEHEPVMYVHTALQRTRSQQAQVMVARMLVVVTVIFFVCYLPVHVQRLLNRTMQCDLNNIASCSSLNNALRIVWAVTGLLHFLSAAINPVVYNLMSRRFRAAFKFWLAELLFSKNSLVR